MHTCFAYPFLSHLLRRSSSTEPLKQPEHSGLYYHEGIIVQRCPHTSFGLPNHFLLLRHHMPSQAPPNLLPCSVDGTRHLSRVRSSWLSGCERHVYILLVQSLTASVCYATALPFARLLVRLQEITLARLLHPSGPKLITLMFAAWPLPVCSFDKWKIRGLPLHLEESLWVTQSRKPFTCTQLSRTDTSSFVFFKSWLVDLSNQCSLC